MYQQLCWIKTFWRMADVPAACEKTPIGCVITQWKEDQQLVLSSAGGVMCKVGKAQDLDRKEVCQNYAVLQPVVQHLGLWVSHMLTVCLKIWDLIFITTKKHLLLGQSNFETRLVLFGISLGMCRVMWYPRIGWFWLSDYFLLKDSCAYPSPICARAKACVHPWKTSRRQWSAFFTTAGLVGNPFLADPGHWLI